MKTKIWLRIYLTIFLLCLAIFNAKFGVTLKAAEVGNEHDTVNEIHSHCICGGEINVGDHLDHSNVTYFPWNGGDFNYDGEDGNTGVAYLYLTSDVVNDANSCNRTDGDGILSIKTGQTLYLCLNGYSLKNGKTDNNVIDVTGSLYLCDCCEKGTIGGRTSGANSGSIWVSSGIFNMYGGSLTGSHGVKNGAGIYAKGSASIKMYGGSIKDNSAIRQAGGVYLTEKSVFIMYDGEISGNSAPDFGGGVIVDNGTTFTMNGGTISNNYSGRSGGGVFVSGGTFIMNGGTISDNIAANGGGVSATYDYGRGIFTMNDGEISNNTAHGSGGGIFIWDRATFTMNNGIISNNNAKYGGGICLYSANKDNSNINNVLDIYAGEIKNNTADELGSGVCCFQYSVVNLYGNDKIVISDNTNTNLYFADKCDFKVDNLTEGSSIGISSYSKPIVGKATTICNLTNNELGDYFFSDNTDYLIKSTDNGIELTADVYTSKIKYETGCEQILEDDKKNGFTETIDLIITSVKPSMPCHKFLGWALEANATTAQYNSGDTITVTGEETLYAVWESVPHDLTLVEEIKATCEQNGVKAHYVCSKCNKKFIDVDEAKNEVTSDEQLVIDHIDHKFGMWQETVQATTEKEGILAHKDCESCGKHFDANGVELTDLKIEKLPVSDTKTPLSSGKIVGITIGITLISVIALEAVAFFIFKSINKKRHSM